MEPFQALDKTTLESLDALMGEAPEQPRKVSNKITSFFPVLRAEGRAKMCSTKAGDSKQKYISTKETSSSDSSMKSTQSWLSGEIARGSMTLSSALKTPLSQVLRRSIEALENNKEEKVTESEKAEPNSDKIKSGSSGDVFRGKAKKSFPASSSSSQLKKILLGETSQSAKACASTSRSKADNVKMDASPENADDKSAQVSESKSSDSKSEATSTTKNISSVKISSQNSSDSASKTSVGADESSASPSAKSLPKGKKGKKRHFRGGTYGLFLTPAKKRKRNQKKSSPDSGSKDDECSLAGTENSSYIDSDDGNSLVSEDFNTPSEKSLADDEPGVESRNSPMLTFDSKNSSMDSKPVSEKQQGKQEADDVKEILSNSKLESKAEGDNSTTDILESLSDIQWEQTTTDLSASKSEFSDMLKVPQYDDISNESFSNSNSFPFNKESLLEVIEDTEIPDTVMFENADDKDNRSVSNQSIPQETVDNMDSNPEISMLLDDLDSQTSCKKEEIEDEVMNKEENIENAISKEEKTGENDISNQEEKIGDSFSIEEQNTSCDVINITPDSPKNFNEDELHSHDEKEDNEAQFSTIATSVKSRQRIKRRFTDDVVDTDIGLLSINSMLSSRKPAPPKPEPPPPTDILESFMPTPNKEAKMGPLTKLECIFSTRQPLIAACTCHEDTYETKLGKDKNNVYCQAVDSIDDKLVGCCNPVVTSRLVRPSVKIPFTVMCEMHLWRLSHHHSCPYCGLFCSQGSFMQCSKEDKKVIHLFHEHCQVKDEGHVPFCLHCGDSTRLKIVELEMNMTSPPTFYLCQHPDDPVAKARITFSSSAKKDKEVDITSEKLHIIAESGKVLSSIGLPNGPNQIELDEMIKNLNSNTPVLESYTHEDFYLSASQGDVSKILDMLALGFDPNNKFAAHEYDTALHAAASENHLTVLHLLIQAGAINDSLNERIYTPLMVATEKSHKDIVHYLVRKGSLTDFRGESGMTSIHIAAKSGELELLKILMGSRKIDVNAQDDGGWTAIVWASEHNHYDVVKYLLDRGANPNIKDNEGNTGLHWSAYSGSSEICFLYLDYGCEIDAVNEHGDTPLHIASRQNKLACVTLFLSRGANVQIKNKLNMLPAECCLDKNSQTYLQLSLNMLLKKITGKYNHKAEKIVHRDISRGKEQIAIQCINAVDEEPPPFNFLYVTENCETMPINIDRTITSLQSCHCEDDCTTTNCTCAQISFKCWYDKEGCLMPDFNMIDPPMLFECNRACSCWNLNCRNRTLQNGITSRLQLVRTKGKGWGVRTLKDIPKGAFICEYVGELISDSEADKREDDSYLFDLDNRDGETYCLDARYYGNISRFINHLCEPNLVPVKIFVDHQDLSFPRIAFFSSREIKQYEELGFDYGEKFWSIKYKWFTCDCGTPKCKYSKDTIHETLANYYRRLKEEQLEETAHIQATGILSY